MVSATQRSHRDLVLRTVIQLCYYDRPELHGHSALILLNAS